MPAMTITQKILARHAGLESVAPGDIVTVGIDVVLANDITAPPALSQLADLGIAPCKPESIMLIPDHFTPNRDVQTARNCQVLRRFAATYPGVNHFEQGEVGIEHAILPEKGLVLPGDLVIGADSHTCTYGGLGAFSTGVGSTDLTGALALGTTWLQVPQTVRVHLSGTPDAWVGGKDVILAVIGAIGTDGALGKTLEFTGPGLDHIGLEGRLTMANMAVEAGAVNGIIAPSEEVLAYAAARASRACTPVYSDADAVYDRTEAMDLSALEPQVAAPHSPGNVSSVNQLGDVALDQVVIGSCTNGRISDLRSAAAVLRGKTVAKGLRLFIGPATPEVFRQALREGLIAIFADAGAVLLPPGCGVCFGGHMGVLGPGEVCLSTTNRNFIGRMGHPQSRIYLASPAVAAASAVMGRIAHPAAVMN